MLFHHKITFQTFVTTNDRWIDFFTVLAFPVAGSLAAFALAARDLSAPASGSSLAEPQPSPFQLSTDTVKEYEKQYNKRSSFDP